MRTACTVIAAWLVIVPAVATATEEKPKIDLNTASASEIESIPSISKALARRILEARAQAPFQDIDELDLIPGIGPKQMDSLRAHATVLAPQRDENRSEDRATTAAPPPSKSNRAGGPKAGQDPAADQEAAFKARLRGLSLDELDQLIAAHKRDAQRWRRQSGLTARCKLRIATSRERETELIRRCNLWNTKIRLLEQEAASRRKTAR